MTSRVELLKQYLQDDHNDPFTLYALALEYVKLNDHSGAEALFDRLLQQHDSYLPSYYQAARLKEFLGKKEDAKRIIDKGVALAERTGDLRTLNELRNLLET